jgi:nitroreductase
METIKAIMTRRSICSYTDRKVTAAQIKKLLEAAMNAPSACNQQAWQFIVVSDRKVLTAITKIHPYAQMLKQASCAIVVCGDIKAEQCKDYWVQDCSAATQNILLAAHALGLGAVWLGVYPRMERLKNLQKLLGMPKKVMPLSIISIGYPKTKVKPVNRYSAKKVHHDKW